MILFNGATDVLRAGQSSMPVGLEDSYWSAVQGFLSRSAAALLFVDLQRRIVWRNARAADFLAEGTFLREDRHGRLMLVEASTAGRFDALFEEGNRQSGAARVAVVAPTAVEGRLPWSLVFWRGVPGDMAAPAFDGYLVQIRSGSEPSPIDAKMLLDTFGLTRKEAAVVSVLAGGGTLQTSAEHLAISPQTAKWHLKNAMAKMHCSSQAQLLLMLENLHVTLV
ncbi:MAG: helix-turn-helix transcriptional regulator [Hyphomicrobiaceae bacterium]